MRDIGDFTAALTHPPLFIAPLSSLLTSPITSLFFSSLRAYNAHDTWGCGVFRPPGRRLPSFLHCPRSILVAVPLINCRGSLATAFRLGEESILSAIGDRKNWRDDYRSSLTFSVPQSPCCATSSSFNLPPPAPHVTSSCPCELSRESPSALIRLLRSTRLTPSPSDAFPHQDTCILISYLVIRIRDSNTKPHVPPVTSIMNSTVRRSSRGEMSPVFFLSCLPPSLSKIVQLIN